MFVLGNKTKEKWASVWRCRGVVPNVLGVVHFQYQKTCAYDCVLICLQTNLLTFPISLESDVVISHCLGTRTEKHTLETFSCVNYSTVTCHVNNVLNWKALSCSRNQNAGDQQHVGFWCLYNFFAFVWSKNHQYLLETVRLLLKTCGIVSTSGNCSLLG